MVIVISTVFTTDLLIVSIFVSVPKAAIFTSSDTHQKLTLNKKDIDG